MITLTLFYIRKNLMTRLLFYENEGVKCYLPADDYPNYPKTIKIIVEE